MTQSNISNVTGIVEIVNDNGFKIQGRSTWLNYSQFGYHGPRYTPNTPAPSVGQQIIAELKNDKFINSLVINGQAQATQAQPPAQTYTNATPPAQPAQFAPQAINQPLSTPNNSLIETTIQTRLKLIGTLAVAQPALFALDQVEELTEIVRNLEQFVLEDLISLNGKDDDTDDPDPEDVDLDAEV